MARSWRNGAVPSEMVVRPLDVTAGVPPFDVSLDLWDGLVLLKRWIKEFGNALQCSDGALSPLQACDPVARVRSTVRRSYNSFSTERAGF